jgi:hypothetical protein
LWSVPEAVINTLESSDKCVCNADEGCITTGALSAVWEWVAESTSTTPTGAARRNRTVDCHQRFPPIIIPPS